ncbi:hypothetical protein E0Z10_g9125 [Xylaria hypoxylon]|uniref:Uncharacterized protein n=1 Tax=Xylaria hypoxylon TaxID=37992 RepID=A0A4Z0YI16_9PEZI|nr:hypothetical protein E0Z10_g9125 [Xylaria hypoxylon]
MELLRQTALSIYDGYENFDASSAAELKIVRIKAEGGELDTATYEIEDVCEANILSRISPAALRSETRAEHVENTTASLLLVSMWTSGNGNACEGIGISKSAFLGLINALEIDRSALQPIVNNVFGLLDFSDTNPSKSTSTHFLADARMQLIWSFNFITSETKGVLITRRGPPDPQSQYKSRQVGNSFLASSSQQRRNIFNPYTLLFISLVQSTREAKSRTPESDYAGTIKWKTGYGDDGDGGRAVPKRSNDTVSSRAAPENLAVAPRHIEALTSSLATDER